MDWNPLLNAVIRDRIANHIGWSAMSVEDPLVDLLAEMCKALVRPELAQQAAASQESQLGTGNPMLDEVWAAQAAVPTIPATPPSPPLDQPTMDAGHVVRPCLCVVSGLKAEMMWSLRASGYLLQGWCPSCGASWLAVPIPAQAAAPTTSTSVSKELDSSVVKTGEPQAALATESTLPSSESSDVDEKLNQLLCWQDKHDWLHTSIQPVPTWRIDDLSEQVIDAVAKKLIFRPSSESSKCDHDFIRQAGDWLSVPTCSKCGALAHWPSIRDEG